MGLTDSELRDYNIDEHEKQFINKKLVGIVSETVIENQKNIILEILEIFRNSVDDYPDKIAELINPDLILDLLTYIERSTFYDNLSGYWSNKLVLNDESEIYTYPNLVHSMYPILVQEIEGPLKKQLKIIDYSLRINNGESINWADFESSRGVRFITGAVSSTRNSSINSRYINGIIDGLDPPGHPINIRLIRNAGAHSDYKVIGNGQNLILRISGPDGEEDINFTDFWRIFSSTLDLIRLLNIGVHLGGRRFLEAVDG